MGIFAVIFFLYTDFKGIWIPRWSTNNSDKIFTYLDNNFNHIFLQVFALGEAYYPSKIVPSRIHSDKWLKKFLKEAHRRGIKVSAWINIFYSWGYAPRPPSLHHPINSYPHWYVVDLAGRSILDYSISELKQRGIEGYYLSPAKIEVQEYIKNIIIEIITQYDFDGVHLDYIRYPTCNFSYDVALRTKFMRRYSYDPKDLLQGENLKLRLGLWGYEDMISQWQKFVCEDMTGFLVNLRSVIKRQNPNILISAAVKPDYSLSQRNYGQDWVNWVNCGVVDFVCLMAYNRDIKEILNRTLVAVKEPHRVVFGLGVYRLKAKDIEAQIALIKAMPFAGVVFFSYEEFKKNHNYLSNILK